MSTLRIACVSLLPPPAVLEHSCPLPQGTLEWKIIPVKPDLEQIRRLFGELLASYDAVALQGLSCTFQIAGKLYRHDYIWHALGLDSAPGKITDGADLRASLERHLVREAAEQLRPRIQGKRILLFSGLNRYGSAEVLSGYSKHLTFGDLLYGFRLGIPITSFSSFVSSAPQLVRAVGQTPASWYWPTARRSPRLLPRFQYYFRTADVIVGSLAHFQRYAPPKLTGKVIFSTLTSPEDIAWFRERGVACLISLTPEVGGHLVPLAVLEAALMLDTRAEPETGLRDRLLSQVQELELKPLIVDFHPAEESEFALAQLPSKPLPEMQPRQLQELVSPPAPGIARFCFVIHPLTFQHVKRLAVMRALSGFVPERFLEDAIAQLHPFPVGVLRDVVSKTGAKAEGLIYAVPMTSKAIMRFPPEFMYRKLEQVADDAAKAGCRLMGLGAYTSVVGDAGETVAQRVSIGVTSGNSYTVAMTLRIVRQTAHRCGIALDRARALVIGASGSIGSICARLLAPQVQELFLVSPRPERLLALASVILREQPHLQGRVRLSRVVGDFLPLADVVITTTSAVDPVIDVAALKPGCVVCDVARPPDIKPDAAAARKDILVIEGGEIKLPDGAELTYDIGLPPGTIYACLAETLLLALDQRFGHFTLGRDIDPQKVRLIEEIGEKHGFDLAAIRSFGKPVSAEHCAHLAALNLPRFAQPAEEQAAAGQAC
jgi:predicted amino acid dehydrogenase